MTGQDTSANKSFLIGGTPKNISITGVEVKSLKIFIAVVALLNLLPVVYIGTMYPSRVLTDGGIGIGVDEKMRLKSLMDSALTAKRVKLILFSDFQDYYRLKERQGAGGLSHCDLMTPAGQRLTCELTVDRLRFPQADAVIFNSFGMTTVFQPGVKPYKRPGQTWTFFAVESPHHGKSVQFGAPAYRDKFNSTMTYRTDSEFWHGYVRAQRRLRPLSQAERASKDAELRTGFRNKTKMAAVFISNCKTPSRRMTYIRQLAKYLPVDIYGECGPLRCADPALCDDMLSRDYKFYLAFENSHCRDYVTEKLLRVMAAARVVPVVRGGSDYGRLFPENSIVDTAQFVSASHLSRHLKKLAGDEDKWVAMFQWTWDWKVLGPSLPICEYCHSLFSPAQPSKLYHDVHQWWTSNTCYPVTDL